jgi:hypothetical protein
LAIAGVNRYDPHSRDARPIRSRLAGGVTAPVSHWSGSVEPRALAPRQGSVDLDIEREDLQRSDKHDHQENATFQIVGCKATCE